MREGQVHGPFVVQVSHSSPPMISAASLGRARLLGPDASHSLPQVLLQFLEAAARDRRDGDYTAGIFSAECGQSSGLGQQVALGEHHDVGFGEQRLAVRLHLGAQSIVHRLWVGRIERNQEGEQPGALDMLQETKTQPLPQVRTFDDAGNVRDDEGAVAAQAHHAEVGLEGRERVVGDLGPGRGDDGEQGALAGVGLSHQSHVGDELERTSSISRASPSSPGSHSRGDWWVERGEAGVTPTASAALGDQQTVARLQHLSNHLSGGLVADHGAGRDGQVDVVGRSAGLVLSLAVLTAFRLPDGVVAIVEQGGEVGRRPAT